MSTQRRETPSRVFRPREKPAFMALCCLAFAWGPVQADVVTMADGRVLEGSVVAEGDDAVNFEMTIGGIQATLALKRSDIKSIEKKALDQEPREESAAAGEAPGKPSPEQAGLYLEVPIVGRFGDDILFEGVRDAVAYAKRRGIKHIVFVVDSDGGAMDEAIGVHRVLSRYSSSMVYHAIVRKCMGAALIVPFWCQTLHMIPGATIGGLGGPMEGLPKDLAAMDERVVRAQMARNLVEEARKRGRTGDFIGAMIDPQETLAGWREADGEVVVGRTPPPGLPAGSLIFQSKRGEVLVLSSEQTKKLGIPSIERGADELGKALGIANWKAESDFGQQAMLKAASLHRERAATAQAKFEDAVKKNVRLRETTAASIEHNLKEAAKWDPTKATYNTFSVHWDWGAGLPSSWDSQAWTPESRAKWQNRNEACGYYMENALAAIQSMIRLEKEAVKLGLKPTFKDGQLDTMLNDATVKLEALQRTRYKSGE